MIYFVDMDHLQLFTYEQVLAEINLNQNHLLIANGFNYGLGVKTGYADILNEMIESKSSLYKDANLYFEKANYDLELFLKEMTDSIAADNIFLKKYVYNKIKLDFMQALHSIVKSQIKHVYAEQNAGIYILLKQFDNYFTLNYDSFLYLLLLKYRKNIDDNHNAIAFTPKISFIEVDLNERHNDIYRQIKQLRDSGKMEINLPEASIGTDLFRLTKTNFVSAVSLYSKEQKKGWKDKDIKNAVDLILEDEQRNQVLEKVEDGFRYLFNRDEFIHDVNTEQNIFFLHGAFHIFRDGKDIKKITQETDKALYTKLEEVLNNEEQDVVCIFQSTNKLGAIKENPYLLNCYNKLSTLSGNMVIIGSSLDDNDNHIFAQIDKSDINKVYISVMPNDIEEQYKKTMAKFPHKQVILFDAMTISYKLEEKEQ